MALFDTSPLTQFSKFNNFLWVCWFLGKNLSNFVPPVWKLYNLYYHNERHEFEHRIKDGKEGYSDNGFPIQVIRALKRQLPVPICIKSTTSLDSAMYEPIGERDTELLIPNGQGNYSKLLHFTLPNEISVCYSKKSDWNDLWPA